MNAKEARAVAEKQAAVLSKKQAAERTKRRESEARAAAIKHEKFYQDFVKSVDNCIEFCAKDGRKTYVHLLASGSSWDADLYGEERFFKKFEFADEVKRAIRRLSGKGYKVLVASQVVKHDDSAAYLNSGGECGSETPYHTYDTILRVSW